MSDLTCDTCGRVGSTDDGIEAGGPCQEPCDGTVRRVGPIRASFLPIVVVTYVDTGDEYNIVDVDIDWSDSFNEDDDECPVELTDFLGQEKLCGPMDALIRSGAFDSGLPHRDQGGDE